MATSLFIQRFCTFQICSFDMATVCMFHSFNTTSHGRWEAIFDTTESWRNTLLHGSSRFTLFHVLSISSLKKRLHFDPIAPKFLLSFESFFLWSCSSCHSLDFHGFFHSPLTLNNSLGVFLLFNWISVSSSWINPPYRDWINGSALWHGRLNLSVQDLWM